MAQEENTVVSAPPGTDGGDGCGRVLGVARSARWGRDSHWHKLKPYQQPGQKWKSLPIEEVSKRSRNGWGWEPPQTGFFPYREWGTGLLKWNTGRSWSSWDQNVTSIECPEFPDVLDEDIFELLRLLSSVKGRFLLVEDNVYRWAIVLVAKRAVNDLGR